MFLKVFKRLIFFIGAIIFITQFTSCKKDTYLTEGGSLHFSTDTLKFDTVFTTQGSVTRSFKVSNNNTKRIKISNIKLEKGSTSFFRMNIDGTPTKDIKDIEIAPNDSIYIFVAVTIDPTNENNPYVIEDKVLFTLNEQVSSVALQAFGQNAHYFKNFESIKSQTWVNDKPYVIINSAIIDSGDFLTIQKGCRIYMHANSALIVEGTLFVYGTKEDSVVFQGDRLDRDYFGYKDTPSEWCGIFFLETSSQSKLNYCVIKNAGNSLINNGNVFLPAAIYVVPNPNINVNIAEFNKCTIANSGGYGVLGFNSNLRFNTCLIHSCGLQNVAFFQGGKYEFNNCTIANYGGYGLNHTQEPLLAVLNYFYIDDVNYTGSDLKTTFNNCILYGSLENEVVFSKKTEWNYDMTLNNCLIKRTTAFESGIANLNNTLINQDPLFTNIAKWDYHPLSTSVVKNAGSYIAEFPTDLDGNQLDNTTQPIGCYKVQ